jgi:hypothetical protein
MFEDLAVALVWILRIVLFAGIVWGAWLCLSHTVLPPRSEKTLQIEHFATYALLVLLLTTLGGIFHAG